MFDKILSAFGFDGNGDDGEGPEMIPCDQALEQLFEYLDGELEESDRKQVERHLEVCRRCYPRLQFEKSFLDALHQVRSGEDPPPDLRNRIVGALEAEGLGPD